MKSLRTRTHQGLIRVLRELRSEAELTQAELAKRLKRPQSFVAKYEAGERRIDVVEFLQLMEALGADPAAVFRRMK